MIRSMTRLASIRIFVAVILSLAASLKAQTSNAPTSGMMLSPLTPTPAEESLRSIDSNTLALISFVNHSSTPVDIYWIGFNGARRLEASGLAVGATRNELTFLTHPFAVVISGTGGTLQPGTGTLLAVFKAVTPNPTRDPAKMDTAIITNLDGSTSATVPQVAPSNPRPDGTYMMGPGITRPLPTYRREPDYSEVARKLGITGTVMVGLVIGADGIPRDFNVQKSLGYGLDEKAIEATQQWQFKPAMKDGTPVPVRVTIDLNFRLIGSPNPKSWHFSGPIDFVRHAAVRPPVIKDVTMPNPTSNADNETVLLGFTVDSGGKVKDIRTIEGSQSASDVIRREFVKWKFQPAMGASGPVEEMGTIRFVKGQDQVSQSPVSTQQTAPPVIANSSQPPQPPTLSNPVGRAEPVRTASDSIDGIIRRLGEKELLLQISSSVVLRFRLLARTEFRGHDGRPVRDSLLHPGDHITVSVNPDDVETALAVVLRKSGSTQEREAASPEVAPETIVTPDPSHFAAARDSAISRGTPSAAATNGVPNSPIPQAAGNNIKFTFKGVSAQVSVNGGQPAPIDLTVELFANTARLSRATGYNGSDVYLDLQGFVSSKTIGLLSAAAITPLSVHIGSPNTTAAGYKNTAAYLGSGNVVSGIFNMRGMETWDRVSPIGPLVGSATSTGPLKVVLKTGEILSITTFESQRPYGKASFQAANVSVTEAANPHL